MATEARCIFDLPDSPYAFVSAYHLTDLILMAAGLRRLGAHSLFLRRQMIQRATRRKKKYVGDFSILGPWIVHDTSLLLVFTHLLAH